MGQANYSHVANSILTALLLVCAASANRVTAAPTLFYGYDPNDNDGVPLPTHPNSIAAYQRYITALNGGRLGNEDFESQAIGSVANSRSLSFAPSGITATLIAKAGIVAVTNAPSAAEGETQVSGGNYLDVGIPFDGDDAFDLTFSVPIQAIGFYTTFVDAGIEIVEDNGTRIAFPTLLSGIGSTTFMGFIDPDHAFNELSFQSLSIAGDSGRDHTAFDNITIGLPEPSFAAAIALVMTSLVRPRRSKL